MSISPMEKTTVQPIAAPPINEPATVDVEYRWHGNNRVELLENGEAYFPRVFEAMRQAKTEILLETFIVFEDKVGDELKEVLVEAAQRGVRVTARLSHRPEQRWRAPANVRPRPQAPGHPNQLVPTPAPQDRGGGRNHCLYRRDQFFR
jgi:phosphatidylserine/phosphatidylglycerophosphate/cardiolipin synthase-like enzyme